MKKLIILASMVFSLLSYDVILDPGHGGTSPGATGPSYMEKDAVLDVGLYARDYLVDVGVTVGMTRSTDATLSLADRCTIANSGGWERFMSIHENAFDCTVQGTETYCYGSGSSNSFDLRNNVHPQLIWAHDYYNRGTKTAAYYVLVYTSMPAILGEGTFIDYTVGWNESYKYAENVDDHEGRQGFAYALGYCNHRGITGPVYGEDPDPPDERDSIIVDNLDPEFFSSGTWNTGIYAGYWDTDYLWASVTGENWARWQPDLPWAGEYEVYMWWLAGSNRCNNVFVRVFSTVNDTFVVSQQGAGGTWHHLGTYNFYEGSSGYVSLGDRTATDGDVVVADAVLWIYNGAMHTDENRMPISPAISAYPNPFNAACRIDVPEDFTATIHDIHGRQIHTLPTGTTIWNANDQPSGVYLIRAQKGDVVVEKRVVLVR